MSSALPATRKRRSASSSVTAGLDVNGNKQKGGQTLVETLDAIPDVNAAPSLEAVLNAPVEGTALAPEQEEIALAPEQEESALSSSATELEATPRLLSPEVQKNTSDQRQKGRPRTKVLGGAGADTPVRPSIYLDAVVAETISFIAKIRGTSVNQLLQEWVLERMQADEFYQTCKDAADTLLNARKLLLEQQSENENAVVDSTGEAGTEKPPY